MKEQRHAALIKAWADGAVIQVQNMVSLVWVDCLANHPAWDENSQYRIKLVPHPHAALIKAHQDGAKIQFRSDGTDWDWFDLTKPNWHSEKEYRVKPEEPKVSKHQWCIDAFKKGAKIQYKVMPHSDWRDLLAPEFDGHGEYRVKPYPDVVESIFAALHKKDGASFPGAEFNTSNGHNLRLTFNTFTGQLKKAEVIK